MTVRRVATSGVVERFTRRSGVSIRYLDNAREESAGLPLLFSPGLTDFADEYVEMLQSLSPRRTIVVEVRGRGGSEAPSTGYTAADHARDLQAVLDEEGIDRFHLMTFSRGTTWALDLFLADPSRVATLSVGDYWAAEKGLDDSIAQWMLASRFRGRPVADRVQPHVITELYRASVERDLFDDIAATGTPMLVVGGTEEGRLLDEAQLELWRTRVPGSEVAILDGSAHDLFRGDRLAYPRLVADFIARRTPGL